MPLPTKHPPRLNSAPVSALSRTLRPRRPGNAIRVETGKDRFGKPVSLLEGDTFYTKVSTQDTEGDTVFGPRMVPHAFAKVGEANLLMFFQPAGKTEAMFQKISAGVTKGMTEAEQDRFREEHGIKRVEPALTRFKNR